MIQLMVGRSLEQLFPKEDAEIGDVVRQARRASAPRRLRQASRSSSAGARSSGSPASSGSGRTEIARSIFGIDHARRRTAWIDGRPFRPRSPRAALRRGLAYLPEDRLSQGLVQPMSICHQRVAGGAAAA